MQRLCRARHLLAPHYHLVGPASGPHPPLADRAGHLRGACGRSGFCGGGEANRGARHLMQPGVQVRKRAAKGAAAWLLTAGPRNRKPLSFHEIKPDSGLMKGRGGDSAGSRSGQLKFDLREGQQLVAAFAGVGAGRALVSGHNRHLELGPKTYCRVWFGRPVRGWWTEDGRRQARIRTRVWVDRWCHSWHTEGELACARFHAPWLDCSRLDTRSEEQEDEDSALQVWRKQGSETGTPRLAEWAYPRCVCILHARVVAREASHAAFASCEVIDAQTPRDDWRASTRARGPSASQIAGSGLPTGGRLLAIE